MKEYLKSEVWGFHPFFQELMHVKCVCFELRGNEKHCLVPHLKRFIAMHAIVNLQLNYNYSVRTGAVVLGT